MIQRKTPPKLHGVGFGIGSDFDKRRSWSHGHIFAKAIRSYGSVGVDLRYVIEITVPTKENVFARKGGASYRQSPTYEDRRVVGQFDKHSGGILDGWWLGFLGLFLP